MIIFTILTYEDLKYNRTYKYPQWALKFGWLLSISSFICIPIYAIYKFIATGGSIQEVVELFFLMDILKKFLKLFVIFLQRYSKVRLARLKSHQLGVDMHFSDNENEHESKVEDENEPTEGETSERMTITVKLNNEDIINDEENPKFQSCSTSEDENLSFANSRTIIKP